MMNKSFRKKSENQESYLLRLTSMSDAIAIAISILVAQFARFGIGDSDVAGSLQLSYGLLTLVLGLAWWVTLAAVGSRDVRIFSSGNLEIKRVFLASMYVFGGLAIFSYALQFQTARGYVAIALPLGLVLLVISRFVIRARLRIRRRRGEFCKRIVLLGGPSAVEHIHRALTDSPEAGYLPVAAILPGYSMSSPTGEELLLPVVSNSPKLQDIIAALKKSNANALAISSETALKPKVIRQLGWQLHEMGVSMIVAPALTDIAGPRLHTQPVAGLPLIHVTTPKLDGRQSFAKRLFDMAGAILMIAILSPIFAAAALLIRMSSKGPIFYSQSRIGQRGQPFKMYKFRSMVVDADSHLESLLASQGTADKPLFKVENDPRITTVGRFLRQYSIDELPQLFNVLIGTMSLVGPRPQRDAEVALYDDLAHRRLMVKPGMSGLWQVNGRSNLTWEQAIRWDLYYVENWSLLGDLVILLRTFRAVMQKDGAI